MNAFLKTVKKGGKSRGRLFQRNWGKNERKKNISCAPHVSWWEPQYPCSELSDWLDQLCLKEMVVFYGLETRDLDYTQKSIGNHNRISVRLL